MRAVTSWASDTNPVKRPASSRTGVLFHSQVMVRPSFVRFALTPWADMSPARRRRSLSPPSPASTSGGTKRSSPRPTASCLRNPKILSAAGFQPTMRKSSSNVMHASGNRSIWSWSRASSASRSAWRRLRASSAFLRPVISLKMTTAPPTPASRMG